MGFSSYSDEFSSPVAPSRLFKALIVDSDNLIPKLIPMAIHSVDITEGDGGAGSFRLIKFAEGPGSPVKFVRHRIEGLDEKNYSYKYSLIEGDGLTDKLEKVTFEVKFEPKADGGSNSKLTATFYTKGDDIVLTEEEIKAGREKALAMYQVVEGYLIQNPNAYA